MSETAEKGLVVIRPEDEERDASKKDMPDLIDIDNLDDFLTIEVDRTSPGVQKSDVNLMKIVYMAVQGYSNQAICTELAISHQALREVKLSDEFKKLKAMVTQEIISVGRMFMMMGTVKAVKTLLDCLNSPNEKVRLQAATEVLNRVGLKQPDQIEVVTKGNDLSNMSEEELLGILNMGRQEILPVIKDDVHASESES